MKPKVITICGSSRFCDIMAVCGWVLERDEKAIVMGLHLLPNWYFVQGSEVYSHLAEFENCADAMDDLHLKKIEMSDEIFVVNYGGYVGKSTNNEIKHAEKLGKKVRYFTDDGVGEAVKFKLNDAEKHGYSFHSRLQWDTPK